ncbi:DUF6154 family protein [Anaerobacillus sp. MEB173]|uniref:DUF6154 family protein n=1 Tax=Anaerobacillus sp. MEB173 TaxID=3383345 RepID=UPI003F8FB28A
MKLINELFQLYRHHFTGDEEDAAVIVYGILQDYDQEDLIDLVKEMDVEQQFEMVSVYLTIKLKEKMDEEGIGQTTMEDEFPKFIN